MIKKSARMSKWQFHGRMVTTMQRGSPILEIYIVIFKDIYKYLIKMTLVHAGLRPGYSTIDNCFVLHTAVCKALSKPKGKLYAVFIDVLVAFDSIDRDLLFCKIYQLGLNGKFPNIGYHCQYIAIKS